MQPGDVKLTGVKSVPSINEQNSVYVSKTKAAPHDTSYIEQNDNNQYIYTPNKRYRAQGWIRISKHLTEHIIPSRIREHLINVYDFIDKSTGMAMYDGRVFDFYNGTLKVFNYGFHDAQSNKELYLVADKQNERRNRQYEYEMREKMYTKDELYNMYNIEPNTSMYNESESVFLDKVNSIFDDNPAVFSQNVIFKTKWHKLMIYHHRNTEYNKKRLTFSMTKTEFIDAIQRYIYKSDDQKKSLIPIIMFNNNGYRVEYVHIIEIGDNINVGISYIYNAYTNSIKATGIHLNKENIQKQHQLLLSHRNCHCLDAFTCCIDDLRIGNPDDDRNRIKDLLKKNHQLKENITALHKESDGLKSIIKQRLSLQQGFISTPITPLSPLLRPPYFCSTPQSISLTPIKYPSMFTDTSSTPLNVTSQSISFPNNNHGLTFAEYSASTNNNYVTPSVSSGTKSFEKEKPVKRTVSNDVIDDKCNIAPNDDIHTNLTLSDPQHIAIASDETLSSAQCQDQSDCDIDANVILLQDVLESLQMEMNEARFEYSSDAEWDFDLPLLPQNTNGVISCPQHNGSSNNNGQKFNDNNTQNKPNAPNNNQNNDKSDDNKRNHRKYNGNNDKNGMNAVSIGCNHLNECEECYIRKHEQIKMLKTIIRNLRSENQYQGLCHDIMSKIITGPGFNNQQKHQKTKRKRRKTTVSLNVPTLDPPKGAKGNIKISRTLSKDIIPNMINERITNVYSYLHKSIGMQYNDGQIVDDDTHKYKIIHFDLHDEKGNDLYGVMDRIDSKQHSYCKWQLRDELMIVNQLSDDTLPQSSRMDKFDTILHNMNQFSFTNKSIERITKKCDSWSSIPVFKRSNNKKRVTLGIIKKEFNTFIKSSLTRINNNKDRLIPILMFDDNSHWIEHILMVNIPSIDTTKYCKLIQHSVKGYCPNLSIVVCNFIIAFLDISFDIGISLQFNDQNDVKITGIHLDKEKISEQHEAVLSLSPKCVNGCHCLDTFVWSINDIYIGNPDNLLNQVNNYKQRYFSLKWFILKFISCKHTGEYEALQEDAQLLIQNDNGTLPMNLLASPTPSESSIRSNISSSPSSSYQYGMHLSASSDSTDISNVSQISNQHK